MKTYSEHIKEGILDVDFGSGKSSMDDQLDTAIYSDTIEERLMELVDGAQTIWDDGNPYYGRLGKVIDDAEGTWKKFLKFVHFAAKKQDNPTADDILRTMRTTDKTVMFCIEQPNSKAHPETPYAIYLYKFYKGDPRHRRMPRMRIIISFKKAEAPGASDLVAFRSEGTNLLLRILPHWKGNYCVLPSELFDKLLQKI